MEISKGLFEAMTNAKPRPVYVKASVSVDEFVVTEVGDPTPVAQTIVDKFPGLEGIVNVTLDGERNDQPVQPVVVDCGTLFQALNEGGIPPEEKTVGKVKKILVPDFTIAINAGKVTCSPKA